MAIIGFLALVLLGFIFLFYSLAGFYVVSSFSGKREWALMVPGMIGVALLYSAYVNSPFTIIAN